MIIKDKLEKLYKMQNGGTNGENIIFLHWELPTWLKCVPTSKIQVFKVTQVMLSDKTRVKLTQFSLSCHHQPQQLKSMIHKEMSVK